MREENVKWWHLKNCIYEIFLCFQTEIQNVIHIFLFLLLYMKIIWVFRNCYLCQSYIPELSKNYCEFAQVRVGLTNTLTPLIYTVTNRAIIDKHPGWELPDMKGHCLLGQTPNFLSFCEGSWWANNCSAITRHYLFRCHWIHMWEVGIIILL